MTNPMNYKTSFGLFNCFLKILAMPSSCKKGFLIQSAFDRANTLDPLLIPQFRQLQKQSGPSKICDLEIRG